MKIITKSFSWISQNILFALTLFLLAFIPLYPKLPIVGIEHTWVYIRLEDFFVALAIIVFFIQVLRNKATLKTPLTIPIFLFWAVGLVSTVFAIFFIFPYIANVFPNVAIFNFLRRVEYLSVFFLAYAAIKKQADSKLVAIVLSITLLLVVGYGIGQRLDPGHFLAYSTMNEEFAKGIPLKLSPLGRIQSTFAGHYDLAAYLVLLIPIIGSMVFGFKNKLAKLYFILIALGGLILLFLTASRVSFVVYLIAISFMLVLQKQKKFIIPVIVLSVIILQFFSGVTSRFGSTISQVDLVVDARTGKAIGIARQDNTGTSKQKIVVEDSLLNGESLPQGSSYINLPSGKENKDVNQITYKRTTIKAGTESAQVTDISGNFVVKRVLAYDVSFTTRFQGEWPRALEAFKRNILLGSGYSSISLATDNNYLRILGEVGSLGFATFVLIFLVIGILIKHTLPSMESKTSKSLVIGIIAGMVGLGLNAVLIDVFEASKVAFVMWMLIGVGVGLMSIQKQSTINYTIELRKLLVTTPALIIYMLIFTVALFSMITANYFVGDDFTWLRWAADCKKILLQNGSSACEPVKATLLNYFTHSEGFFYRPAAKLYYYFMYAFFGLSPFSYHVVSILLHFGVSAFAFLLSKKFLNSKLLGFCVAAIFLVLSAHSETIYWVSATGFLFVSFFTLSSLWFYILFRERQNWLYALVSLLCIIIAPFFHELGVVAPLFLAAYDVVFYPKRLLKLSTIITYILFILSVGSYWYMRNASGSLWFNGDYSYNLSKLPYNVFGNLLGYTGLTFYGTQTMSYYQALRDFSKLHVYETAVFLLVFLAAAVFFWNKKLRKSTVDMRPLVFGLLFFAIGLLPFLGLGNIAIRYEYLASFGLVLVVFALLKPFISPLIKRSVIGSAVVFFVVALFVLYHTVELQRIERDWKKAGAITNNMLLVFNSAFALRAQGTNPVFYFLNVPIRLGEAWVFPVGLPDALWFTFGDTNLVVRQPKTVDEAFAQAEGSPSSHVYEFNSDGNIEEIVKDVVPPPTPAPTPVRPVKK
jgi:hypothetical protein